MADVGDEVGAHRIEAGSFADIVDGDQRAAVLERDRMNGQDRARRPDELDGLTAGVTTYGPTHVTLDGLFDQHRGVAVVRVRGDVLDPGLAGRIGEHDPDRQRIERPPQLQHLSLQLAEEVSSVIASGSTSYRRSTTTKRHHGVCSPSAVLASRGISPVSSVRARKRWAPWCSGSHPVITNRTRSPTLTA